MAHLMPLLRHDEKQALQGRVIVGGYYTDGFDLYVVTALGANGCVTIEDCWPPLEQHWERCLSIETFRIQLWLVRGPATVGE